MAIRSANDKTSLANSIIAPPTQHICKLFGRQRLAPLIEQDSTARGLGIDNAPADLWQFGQLARPCETLLVALNQLSLRRAGNLSASDDMKQNRAALPVRSVNYWP